MYKLCGHGGKKWQKRKRKVIERCDNRCVYCLQQFTAELPATIDHVIPVSKGGKNNTANLVAACHRCNEIKADRIIKKGEPIWIF